MVVHAFFQEVESQKFHRLAGKMAYHGLDDPTIQFEMAPGDVGQVPANGRSYGKG